MDLPGPKSVLVKRTAKDRAGEDEDAATKPAKKVKAAANPGALDDEVLQFYQKGQVAKVRCFSCFFASWNWNWDSNRLFRV